jgi:hypothetical protein
MAPGTAAICLGNFLVMAVANEGFEPDSVMVRVGEGIGSGERGEREAARALFAELWEEIGGDAGDALHRCAIAHSMVWIMPAITWSVVGPRLRHSRTTAIRR